jgi:hypothetical protein
MKWYHLLAGSLIAGIICFCVLRWVFHFDINNSIGASFAAAFGGLTAEYARMYIEKKKISRMTKRSGE